MPDIKFDAPVRSLSKHKESDILFAFETQLVRGVRSFFPMYSQVLCPYCGHLHYSLKDVISAAIRSKVFLTCDGCSEHIDSSLLDSYATPAIEIKPTRTTPEVMRYFEEKFSSHADRMWRITGHFGPYYVGPIYVCVLFERDKRTFVLKSHAVYKALESDTFDVLAMPSLLEWDLSIKRESRIPAVKGMDQLLFTIEQELRAQLKSKGGIKL